MKTQTGLTPSIYSILFLIGIFFISISSLSGQNWLQQGQQWTYIAGGGFPNPDDGLRTLSITGDTIIASKNCKILSDVLVGSSSLPPFLFFAYTEGDAVYAYESSENDFIKIYDFSMVVGDTLIFPNNKKYRVDSVGTMEINGRDFRFQQVSFFRFSPSPNPSEWRGPYLIVEEMGFIGKLIGTPFPFFRCSYFLVHRIPCDSELDGQDYRLQCYNNGDFTYDPYNYCQTTSTNEIISSSFKLYPNPTSDFFNIASPPEIEVKQIILYDMLGKVVYSTEIQDAKVNVSSLPAQTYFVKIIDRSGAVYFSRVVVD